jgi:hypothetical protein
MGGVAYRSVERLLYDLGEPADASPVQPHLRLVRSSNRPGPRGPFRESVRRIDLSIAARQLTPGEIEIVRRHYILKVQRYRRADREPIIRKLAGLLADD